MLEKSCGWWLIWYFLFFCHGGAEGQLQWVVKEKITDYGQDLTLFCPAENCCSSEPQAGWFVEKESKILDVTTFSNDPNSKYHATYNTDGFGIVIRNLSEADFNFTYHCNYGFNESTPTSLRHGDVFKERGNTSKNVPDKDKDEENNTVTTLSILGYIVASIVVGVIIIVCIRKMKRQICKGTEAKLTAFITSDVQQGTEAELTAFITSDDQQGSVDENQPIITVYQQDPPTVNVQQLSNSVTTGNQVTLLRPVSTNDVQWQRSISGTSTCAISGVGTGQSTTTTLSVTENSSSNPDEVPLMEVVVVYRVIVTFTEILYRKQLDDWNSNEFKRLAENIQKVLTGLYDSVPGKQKVVVVEFKEGSLLTIFELRSQGYDKESVLQQTIEKPLKDGIIGSYKASLERFKFRAFSVVYRVNINLTNKVYTKLLDDRNSNEFKSLAGVIENFVTTLYANVPGKQEVEVMKFKSGSLLTTFDLTSRGYYGESVLRKTIEKPLKDGILGSYKASPEGFDFRAFSGDFYGAIETKYRTKPKIPEDLVDDKTFLSKLLEEYGKNTEGLYLHPSGIIDVEYFPASLLEVVMKYRKKTKIIKEVLKDMSTTLTSQSPATVVIVYHRSVKTAKKEASKVKCKEQTDIFEGFSKEHNFYYDDSPCLQQKSAKNQ